MISSVNKGTSNSMDSSHRTPKFIPVSFIFQSFADWTKRDES